MSTKLITAPAALPLNIEAVRKHLKQDITDDDDLILIYLASAVEFAQMQTQRQLVAARYQYVIDSFPGQTLTGVNWGEPMTIPGNAILLPKSPLIQVVSITYIDMGGTTQTMPSTDYTVDASCTPPRITPIFGKIWPIAKPQISSVQITFDCGYVAPLLADATADTITLKGWGTLAAGDVLRFSNSGGALPAPIVSGIDYAVNTVVSAGVYKLTDPVGGGVLNITSAGTGLNFAGQTGLNDSLGEIPGGILAWMLLRSDGIYSHRGETANSRGVIQQLPWADRLLDPHRVLSQ